MDVSELLHGTAYLPILVQLLLLATALFLLLGIRKTDTVRIARVALPLLGVLAARDIVFLFLTFPLFAGISDLLPILFLLLVLFLDKKNTRYILALVGGVLLCATSVVLLFLPLPAIVSHILALVTALAAFALLFITDTQGLDRRLSTLGLVAFATALLLPLIVPLIAKDSGIRSALILPLAYTAFVLGLVDYWRILQDNILKDRDFQSDTVDTLYGFVSRASDTISTGADIQALTAYVAQTLATETDSDGALVLMVDDFEDQVVCRGAYGEPDPLLPIPDDIPGDRESMQRWLSSLNIPLTQGLIAEIIQSGKAHFIPDCSENDSLVLHDTLRAGSAIISPFIINDRVIGMSILTRHESSRHYRDEDFDRASLMADFASLVINNVYSFQDVTERTDIDTAAAIAADIQKTVTPRKIKDLPLADFSFLSKPARGVCGDYFDVIPARKDRIYLVMCDVAGKGVPASLIMVMIRAILYLVTNTKQDAATILNWVNRGITGKIDLDHFATLQILIYNPLTGECEYANAGHRPPLIWKSRDGIVDAVEIHSVPIGVEKAHEYKATHFTLDTDDIVLLYTDGVVETMNGAGRQFGIRNLTTILHKSNDVPVKELVTRIDREITDFAGSVRQHDDQTVLAMKVKR